MLGAAESERPLVTGAVGVVGAFVVRLATERGWQVNGLARLHDGPFVRGLDADFTSEPTSGWDAVADTAAIQEEGLALVRHGGRLVGVRLQAARSDARGVSTSAVSVAPDAGRLATMLESADGASCQSGSPGNTSLGYSRRCNRSLWAASAAGPYSVPKPGPSDA